MKGLFLSRPLAALTTLFSVGLLALLTQLPVAAQNQRPRWYAVHEELNERGQSLNLGERSQTLVLRSGWSCAVGAASMFAEARTTVCRKGPERFEFSVQCESSRPKDHTQIRFPSQNARERDFIEVGCEIAP